MSDKKNTAVVAISCLVGFGIFAGGLWYESTNPTAKKDEHDSPVPETSSEVQKTTEQLWPGMEIYTLRPGAEPIEIFLNGTTKIEWSCDSADYFKRYIKMNGMPWRPQGANAEGWMPGNVSISGDELERRAGRILAMQFVMPTSRPKRVDGKHIEAMCRAAKLRCTFNPIRNR